MTAPILLILARRVDNLGVGKQVKTTGEYVLVEFDETDVTIHTALQVYKVQRLHCRDAVSVTPAQKRTWRVS